MGGDIIIWELTMKQDIHERLPTGDTVQGLHDRLLSTEGWPPATPPEPSSQAVVWYWIERNHFHNARLWAEADLARRTLASDAEITANKRSIDAHNQARNDAVERIDEWLLVRLGLVTEENARSDSPEAQPGPHARLNSETAGSMVDRLSILALKCHAMHAQILRNDVDHAHRCLCLGRLARLLEQREDLASCLDSLLADTQAGTAWFKINRQFKMYNDPAFNPVLVAERAASR